VTEVEEEEEVSAELNPGSCIPSHVSAAAALREGIER
jgi:hypothetical protein